ncbi:hypothetical protein [Pedobacter sp. L105]|uniref:hypothetical protein n=1 Tax=Pedobacter sp. L105 TaxID=1641871 RepID=UPI00131D9198|nr:hypothetical protein [Pedobacter sp. L105]
MKKYYVNDRAQNSGDHEVHDDTCPYLHLIVSKTFLGNFSSCSAAVKEAKKTYSTADGCAICSPTCNKG